MRPYEVSLLKLSYQRTSSIMWLDINLLPTQASPKTSHVTPLVLTQCHLIQDKRLEYITKQKLVLIQSPQILSV